MLSFPCYPVLLSFLPLILLSIDVVLLSALWNSWFHCNNPFYISNLLKECSFTLLILPEAWSPWELSFPKSSQDYLFSQIPSTTESRWHLRVEGKTVFPYPFVYHYFSILKLNHLPLSYLSIPLSIPIYCYHYRQPIYSPSYTELFDIWSSSSFYLTSDSCMGNFKVHV